MMDQKILITGGAGFLGSHLCDFYVNSGNDVTCLDDFSTGTLENICHLVQRQNFQIIEHNVEKPFTHEADLIFNLACPASPSAYQEDPITTIKTAVLGTLNVLNLAKRNKAKIFQASTSEVYGDSLVHPQPETYWGNVNPLGPRACYDEGKRCAEALCIEFHRQHNVDIRLGRIFNTYGPRMKVNDGRAVSNFIVQALNSDPISIYGTGQQTRSFCYVDDMIKGIHLFVTQDRDIGPVNIGNPHEIMIKDLAEIICRLTSSRSCIDFEDLPMDDPIIRQPDISRISKVTSWSPTVSLEDGLKETIAYYKQIL